VKTAAPGRSALVAYVGSCPRDARHGDSGTQGNSAPSSPVARVIAASSPRAIWMSSARLIVPISSQLRGRSPRRPAIRAATIRVRPTTPADRASPGALSSSTRSCSWRVQVGRSHVRRLEDTGDTLPRRQPKRGFLRLRSKYAPAGRIPAPFSDVLTAQIRRLRCSLTTFSVAAICHVLTSSSTAASRITVLGEHAPRHDCDESFPEAAAGRRDFSCAVRRARRRAVAWP
jgi:hypothetical protein